VAVIPENEIEVIRRTVEGSFRVEPHPFLRCGDPVRVIRGSLRGVEGILVRKKNQFRLVLSVEMLAKSVAVEIEATDVESVERGIRPLQAEDAGGLFSSVPACEAQITSTEAVGSRLA
jgi:hypothetical protein